MIPMSGMKRMPKSIEQELAAMTVIDNRTGRTSASPPFHRGKQRYALSTDAKGGHLPNAPTYRKARDLGLKAYTCPVCLTAHIGTEAEREAAREAQKAGTVYQLQPRTPRASKQGGKS